MGVLKKKKEEELSCQVHCYLKGKEKVIAPLTIIYENEWLTI